MLVFGLVLSIALMGIAATFIARLLQKHRWIAYVGLAIILYVAVEMIWRGVAGGAAGGRRPLDSATLQRGWKAAYPLLRRCLSAR